MTDGERVHPAKIGRATSGAIITKLVKHQAWVRGLDFNSFSPNLPASGEDGELCIWDLASPTKPSPYPALKSTTGGPTRGGRTGVESQGAAHLSVVVVERTTVVDLKRATGDFVYGSKLAATVFGVAVEPRGGDAAHRRER